VRSSVFTVLLLQQRLLQGLTHPLARQPLVEGSRKFVDVLSLISSSS
jgi:hypothetical protein